MTLASANEFPSLLIKEGAAPASPSAGDQRLFIDSADHLLKYKNSGGTVTGVAGAAGSVATDTIWDASGDLVQGTGANTAAKLTLGATGTVPTAGASSLAYAYPPGYEMAYAEFTSPVTLAGTNEAGATSIVAAGAVSFDGSTIVMIEGFIPNFVNQNAVDNGRFWLYDGASSIGEIGRTTNPQALTAAVGLPVLVRRRMTPSNASHTYSIRGSSSGSASAGAGAGGAGNTMPGYIRITRV